MLLYFKYYMDDHICYHSVWSRYLPNCFACAKINVNYTSSSQVSLKWVSRLAIPKGEQKYEKYKQNALHILYFIVYTGGNLESLYLYLPK